MEHLQYNVFIFCSCQKRTWACWKRGSSVLWRNPPLSLLLLNFSQRRELLEQLMRTCNANQPLKPQQHFLSWGRLISMFSCVRPGMMRWWSSVLAGISTQTPDVRQGPSVCTCTTPFCSVAFFFFLLNFIKFKNFYFGSKTKIILYLPPLEAPMHEI